MSEQNRPLTNRELRALMSDAVDVTLSQARTQFAEYRAHEESMPDDPYAATLTNLLDAIFYMRFGGQWRATAAPHVFAPLPLDGTSARRPPRVLTALKAVDSPTSPSVLRHISRALFST